MIKYRIVKTAADTFRIQQEVTDDNGTYWDFACYSLGTWYPTIEKAREILKSYRFQELNRVIVEVIEE
jgi:hypothetical protein